jgi:hypothetical protein
MSEEEKLARRKNERSFQSFKTRFSNKHQDIKDLLHAYARLDTVDLESAQ